jgi:hypothetical protein
MYLAHSTEHLIPIISEKIFGYFFPGELMSVPHLKIECFSKTSLSAGTVAPIRKHKQN